MVKIERSLLRPDGFRMTFSWPRSGLSPIKVEAFNLYEVEVALAHHYGGSEREDHVVGMRPVVCPLCRSALKRSERRSE